MEYLGIDIFYYMKSLEEKFEEGMCLEINTHVSWYVNYITLLLYNNPLMAESIKQLYYTNNLLMSANENISKGNLFVG